jgi:hypothetical protein
MAVLIEGLCVVVNINAIATKHAGGVKAFAAEVPNASLCADGELARVGFMTPDDARGYVEHLERRGLKYLEDRNAVDIVVVDQRTGPCVACNWVTFGRVDWDRDPKRPVAVCRANPTQNPKIVAPKGWVFERSLSAQHVFVENGKVPANLKLVRHEDGLDVYRDAETGQEFFVARTRASGDPN